MCIHVVTAAMSEERPPYRMIVEAVLDAATLLGDGQQINKSIHFVQHECAYDAAV